MKNITKKIIAVFAVLCVAMTSFVGCAGKPKDNNSSSSSSEGDSSESSAEQPQMQYPLSIGKAGGDNDIAIDDPDVDLKGDDPVSSEESSKSSESKSPVENPTEVQDVTDSKGEPVTEVVEVTKANGEKEIDDNGKPVTETVKVTTVVTKPTEANDEKTTESATKSSDSDYTPKSDGRYAMWLDVSRNENFFFEGSMLKATFKVKEGIPDGDYKIRISPDLSDVAGVAVYPSKVVDGIIRVNNGEIEAVDVSNETGMIFYGDNISCKQGDTIDFNINIKNNSGLVAFCIWFYFDSNALEFVDAGASGEFEEIAYNTEIGSGKKAQ
ncbi:MAG: hypothetical protein K2G83_04020 [Ruminococcus sp.]|nr:hypothetical protein [Ruminococcus sp.]